MSLNRRKWLCQCCALGAVQWLLNEPALAQGAGTASAPASGTPAKPTQIGHQSETAMWATGCEPSSQAFTGLPSASQALLAKAFEGLQASQLLDTHAHLLGNGDSGSGCTLHPSLTQGFNPLERMRHRVILDAACVNSQAPSVDRAYVQRLLELAQAFPTGAQWLLFAFDRAHDDAGRAAPEHTTFYVPDAYARAVAQQHPQRFAWVASVHPYRADALPALRAAAQQGARAVKWLPSSMNIALKDARSLRFAEEAGRLGLPVIVHCGEEKAVPGALKDAYSNPLHVRGLLERGATVVVAHCASLGQAVDEDKASAPSVPAFDLFARMMEEKAHGQRLLADVSAVFQGNRNPDCWKAVLRNQHWHGRLLNGSDYPLPGVAPLIRMGKLQSAGVITPAQADALGPIRKANSLLFDFALKRVASAGGAQLLPQVFATQAHFEKARV